jgi:glutamate dehydrogenase (NADP+)
MNLPCSTGKGLAYGGSLVRKEATGYGLCYFTEEMLKTLKNDSFANKKVAVSGSGNVAIYAIEKIYQLKGLPVTASDSDGFIYDPKGINLGNT